MRERILSSVLLPAPFPPMIPTTSPSLISNETSRSAQKFSGRVRSRKLRSGENSADLARRADAAIASRSVGNDGRVSPMRYCLPIPLNSDGYVAHRYTSSAKVRSIRRK
jgi:hypothetical protein